MTIEQIQNALEKSGRYLNIVRIGNDKLLISTELGLEGISSTISLHGESSCLLKHPAALYETMEQAQSFLEICNRKVEECHGIEVVDDYITKCIMAIKPVYIKNERYFLETLPNTFMDFVLTVVKLRDTINEVKHAAFYPSQMRPSWHFESNLRPVIPRTNR